MGEHHPSPSTQRISKRRRIASARIRAEEDPQSEPGLKCANCIKRKISCDRPSTDTGINVCDPCRVRKMKCEYAVQRRGRGRPRKQVPGAPSSSNNSAAQPQDQGTTPASAGHAGAGRAPANSGGGGGGCRPNSTVSASFNVNVDGQQRTHSVAVARPLPSRAVQVQVPVASSSGSNRAQARVIQPRLQTPAAATSSQHDALPPPPVRALDLEDQLDRTKESLVSLKSQYMDTNRARVDALAQLKKAYFRLQNTMGAVSSNLHELEELLLESLQAESQPGHTGMHESFQDKFVGLNAELRDIVVLRAEHDQTVKQYEHLEELSRKHNLDGDVLERMALQTRAR